MTSLYTEAPWGHDQQAILQHAKYANPFENSNDFGESKEALLLPSALPLAASCLSPSSGPSTELVPRGSRGWGECRLMGDHGLGTDCGE